MVRRRLRFELISFLIHSAPTKTDEEYFGMNNGNGQSQATSSEYSTVPQANYPSADNGDGDQLTLMNSIPNDDEFTSGDFVVSRMEVFQDWPPLWRIDGKTLLQKFEPFTHNNKTIYRSISTVSGALPIETQIR